MNSKEEGSQNDAGAGRIVIKRTTSVYCLLRIKRSFVRPLGVGVVDNTD